MTTWFENIGKLILFVLTMFVVMALILGAFWAFIVMLLWNAVMPVFNIVQIDYWHAWGLYLLAAILIKSYSYSNTNTHNYNAHG